MQLVQAGKIGLDDSEALYKLCPELGEVKLLETGETPKNKITLRMLMSHTAGGFLESFILPARTLTLVRFRVSQQGQLQLALDS